MRKTTEREIFRKGLKRHRGSIKRLCELTGYDRTYVYRVLKGEYQNDVIIETAGQILIEYEQEAVERRRRIAQISEQARSFAMA